MEHNFNSVSFLPSLYGSTLALPIHFSISVLPSCSVIQQHNLWL